MIAYEVMHRLMDQARVLQSFMLVATIVWGDDDDRSDELRVADHVAWRAGYTAQTTPTYEEVVTAIEHALYRENRRGGQPSRVDDAPEFTP